MRDGNPLRRLPVEPRGSVPAEFLGKLVGLVDIAVDARSRALWFESCLGLTITLSLVLVGQTWSESLKGGIYQILSSSQYRLLV